MPIGPNWPPGGHSNAEASRRRAQTPEPSEALQIAMLIVQRCRNEGAEARRDGGAVSECPYGSDRELERSGWLDGWSKS